jgi:hypothetical protein
MLGLTRARVLCMGDCVLTCVRVCRADPSYTHGDWTCCNARTHGFCVCTMMWGMIRDRGGDHGVGDGDEAGKVSGYRDGGCKGSRGTRLGNVENGMDGDGNVMVLWYRMVWCGNGMVWYLFSVSVPFFPLLTHTMETDIERTRSR